MSLMSGNSAAKQPPAAALAINDRYRIEHSLGRGGMGEVLAVVEEASGQHFALKRLLPGAKPRHALQLSREFHTLASLKHPHVVQAFDYGTSDGVPYYTMELLRGHDVESLAPLPWREVVPILRDVASALSLIHARHLIHRDVGARNVWRTPEGVVKLIDFGALTQFGTARDIAGTAPYVAPEAVRTRNLDQRTDLYSLGALGYVLLTGNHAFPARAIAELEQHWSEGLIAPSLRLRALGDAHLPELPERLEQLIEALLAESPDARPASAAEVLDRLDLVLPGPSSFTKVALDGVLASKAFVGRASEHKRLKMLLKRALGQMGASAALLGASGIGRSRLLSELAVEARVAGAAVIQTSGAGDRSALSAATSATLKLFQALPSLARARAVPYASVLGHLSEELRALLDVAPDALERFPQTTGEGRIRLQSALHNFWIALASEKPIVLLVDDLQQVDEASSALFTTLARDAAGAKLLVVCAVRSEQEGVVPASAQAFVEKAVVLGLGGLTQDECAEMLRSIFGDTAHLLRTAQHLSEQVEGNPGQLMELCEYLVRSEKIRCIDGAWVLPQELSELSVPDAVVDLGAARLMHLSEDARGLASALCVIDGALPLELCSMLSPLPLDRLFAALSELCGRGVLLLGESGYAYRREALRSGLYAGLDAAAAERAHATAGEALLRLGELTLVERMAAGVHLLRGGRARQGAEVVQRALRDAVIQMPEERGEIARQLEQAIGFLRKLGLSEHELFSYLCVLAWCGYFVDRRLGFTYGDEALGMAQRVCGMTLARRLSRFLGKKLGLYLALICAALVLRRKAKHSALVPDFKFAMRLLMITAGSLSGMYTLCIARSKVLSTIDAIEPLTALGPDHIASIVHQFGISCAHTVGDRLGQARRHWERLIARLDDPRPIKGLEGTSREYYTAASLYGWGGSECWRDKSRALEIADRLERQSLKLYQVSADQMRAVYYANQGNMREASHYQARVETRALQRGATWQVEIWEPSSAISLGMRQYDAMMVKRAAGQLSHLSADTPSLRAYVDSGRASYLLLRGRPAEALSLLEPLVKERDPLVVGYANLVGLQAQAYNALERFADAERVASQQLALHSPEDLTFPAMTLRLQIELALAEAGLGRHDKAAAQLDTLIALHAPAEGPLTLGALHDARASVALRAHQETVARQHIEAMERWYRSTDCPTLIQHCDRIAKRGAKARARAAAAFLPGVSFLASISTRLTSALIQDTPEELLTQLVRGTVAAEGVLWFSGSEGLPARFKTRAEALPEGLEAWIAGRMSSALNYTTQTEDEEDELANPNLISFEDKTWRLFLLVSDRGACDTVVGAIALCNPVTEVPLDILRSLAEHLQGEHPRSPSSQWSVS
jgi:hypothetical protein